MMTYWLLIFWATSKDPEGKVTAVETPASVPAYYTSKALCMKAGRETMQAGKNVYSIYWACVEGGASFGK